MLDLTNKVLVCNHFGKHHSAPGLNKTLTVNKLSSPLFVLAAINQKSDQNRAFASLLMSSVGFLR